MPLNQPAATPIVFDRVVPRTLHTEVTDAIRSAIIGGKVRPGERLNESAIAEQLCVSRSPVREALRKLHEEGLVAYTPNQGSFVQQFSEADIREIFTLRGALEALACEEILNRGGLDPEDFRHLEDIEKRRQGLRLADSDQSTALDIEFHEFILRKSEFPRLLRIWQSLRAQIQILMHQRFRELSEYAPQTAGIDHAAVLSAFREKDGRALAELHRKTNQRVAEETVQVLNSVGGLKSDREGGGVWPMSS